VRLLALAALMLVSTLAFAQTGGETPPDGAICPLSESQSKNSIEAFAKIAAAISKENRCLGCHGRVNPYIDGTGADPDNPDAPPSEFEHGPGAVDRNSTCNDCHGNMAHRSRDGSESVWMTAPDFLSFIGKDAKTLCKQIRDILPNAKDFMGHVKDDNGGNNFADTAFNGDRGLDRSMFTEKDVPTEKPHITHAALLKLAQDWVDSTGGEFKGDKSCGCEPAHYALQISTVNEINLPPVHRTSIMKPIEVPIKFEDDGSFTGEGAANFQASGTALMCSGQASSGLTIHASGQAIQTSQARSMQFQLDNSSPTVTNASVQCPYIGERSTHTTTEGKTVIPFDFKGNVGEAFDYHMPVAIPGVNSTMHVEVVKRQ
jgi:hypothetical protein